VSTTGACHHSLMVMDNNGRGRIVRDALVNSEAVPIITKVMETFKAANPKSSDLRAVVLDKDCSEIACVQHVFPGAYIVLCKFHVLKTFRSAVARLVQGGEAKQKVSKILETLVCGNDFDASYTSLQATAGTAFLEYATLIRTGCPSKICGQQTCTRM